jgi:hypothetical protein
MTPEGCMPGHRIRRARLLFGPVRLPPERTLETFRFGSHSAGLSRSAVLVN